MPLEKYEGCKYCIINIMFSITEWPVYLLMGIALIIVGLLLK